MTARRFCLYSPADLNLVSGSSIWVQAVAETLHRDEDAAVVLPLRSPERRGLITDGLRSLPRLTLVDPRRQDPHVPPSGLYAAQALDLIEALDREAPFDAIVLRSFPYCLAAIERPALRGRLWSTYVLEPERDLDDPEHVRDLGRIAEASRYVVVQSEGMRSLLEGAVPAARGRTVILPPAVPPAGAPGVPDAVAPPAPRMAYAGKFHPFYPVPAMIDALTALRPEFPGLEFHVLGDQISRAPGQEAWADDLERRLVTTEGVVWHGAVARDDVIRILHEGGVALSLWDYRHGSRMNDLVVSTKLLDYCLAGVPVILNRTAAQEEILGADYPLFVRSEAEATERLRAVLSDPGLHRSAAERCRAAVEPFRYPAVHAGLAPFLEGRQDAGARMAARPKLPGASRRIGLPLAGGAAALPSAALEAIGAVPAAHLVAGIPGMPGGPDPEPGRDPVAGLRTGLPEDLAGRVSVRTVTDPWNWWRTLGILYLPEAVELDPDLVAIGRDSGAVVARTAAELAAAIPAPNAPAPETPR
jgi:glycosyltransferase involved in cell wall biosynthesis